MTLTLPQNHRDQGFQRHISRLERAEQLHGRDTPAWQAVLNEPWVTDHPYRLNTETHCMHGHVDDQYTLGPTWLVTTQQQVMQRQCKTCGSLWNEPMEPVEARP